MKKSKLLAALVCSASMLIGSVVPSVTAMADGTKVVTLGADLSEDQKNTMLKYFKVDASQVQIIYVTNQDEREHLSSYVPLEQIGTRTVSCAYVKPTTSGGIKVRTANLNWVTCNMIASSLSTSGVTNCEVVAACPFEVSGTGALTGIQMAYEAASGEKLDETKKEIATEEMVVTGNIADSVGQNNATTVINQAKMQVIADNVQNADDIYNIVVNIANNNNVSLTDDELNTIVNLLTEIAQQNYDYSEMQETLERVNDNVTGQAEESTDSSEDDSDSIVDNVDQSALGDDVIESSTEDPGLAEETGTSDSSDSEEMEEYQAGDESTDSSETGDVTEDTTSSGSDETDSDEVTDVSQLNTDFLDDEAKAKFEKAKTFCQGEYEGDEDALHQVMGEDAVALVTLDSDSAKKISLKVLEKYLGILGNGAASYSSDGTEKYITPELNMLDEQLKKLFGIDIIDDGSSIEDIDILGADVSDEDKATLYKDTMKFFENLYGETTDSTDTADSTQSSDIVEDDSAADEVGEDSYSEDMIEEEAE